MRKNDKEVVLNLAEESARLDHFDYFLLTLKDSNEIGGWSPNQSSFTIRSFPQVSPSKNSIKRKSSENPIFNSRISINPKKNTKKRLYSRERKLPIIVQGVPRLHFVHAPFQLNLSKQRMSVDSQVSLSAKIPEHSKARVRKHFFQSDFSKNQSEDVVKVRSIGKHYSSFELCN